MRVFFAVVAVLLFAVYGFTLTLPTGNGTLQVRSGFVDEQE